MKTNNKKYNELLKKWGAEKAECEECNKDLTGKDVHQTCNTWVCDTCLEECRPAEFFWNDSDRDIDHIPGQ